MNDEPKNSNPQSNGGPKSVTVPMWIFILTLLLLYLGAVYFDHHGGWFDAQVYAPYGSADELDAYQPKSGAAAEFAMGKKLFDQNCAICHGTDGLGKPNQAPPLAGSQWVNAAGVQRLARIPLAGLNGPIDVAGHQLTFPSGMVAIGAAMSDSDLAAVLTYVRGSWGNKAAPVAAGDVKDIRAKLGAHPQPMTEGLLMKLPE